MQAVPEGLEQIRTAWANQNLIPVVGAGVCMGAAGLPSWPALLEHGIEYTEQNKADLKISDADINALVAAANAKQLIHGFDQLQEGLGGTPGGVHYQAFLYKEFSKPNVTYRQVLDALTNLRCRVVVTTNYDLLLERWNVVKAAENATWLQPDRILSILRARRGIIHLHGRYDLPDSVILSSADYHRIVDSKRASAVADAMFHSGVLLFIGCSLESVHDQHLRAILERFSELQGPLPEGATPHYMLVAGEPSPIEWVRLRKLGIVPIPYGSTHAELPGFLRTIPGAFSSQVPTEDMYTQMRTLRGATTLEEVLAEAKQFIERVVYRGRNVRIGFAVKTEENGRTLLSNRHLIPPAATHNNFSYPQTVAAWSLIEGQILAIPADKDRACDFGLLKKLNKLDRVRTALLSTDAAADSMLAKYLDPNAIKAKTMSGTLTMSDLYQDWVGGQPVQHYKQFISIPVPVVETKINDKEPPEYGVLNIDTQEEEPLLAGETIPLLKLVSEMIALAFEHVQQKGN